MYLLILESIGTSELILIGVIALIVFGPRKLPQMAKTIGKTMADFRRTTNDFKSTWEREAEFFKEEKVISPQKDSSPEKLFEPEKTIAKKISGEQSLIAKPEIKELEQDKIDQVFSNIKSRNPDESESEEVNLEKTQTNKRDWL